MVVTAVAKAMVAGCVTAAKVPGQVDNKEEGEGEEDKVRRWSTVLTYRTQLVGGTVNS